MPRKFTAIKDAEDKAFFVEDAARTLIEANRIKKDKALMKEVNIKLKEIAAAATAAKT